MSQHSHYAAIDVIAEHCGIGGVFKGGYHPFTLKTETSTYIKAVFLPACFI